MLDHNLAARKWDELLDFRDAQPFVEKQYPNGLFYISRIWTPETRSELYGKIDALLMMVSTNISDQPCSQQEFDVIWKTVFDGVYPRKHIEFTADYMREHNLVQIVIEMVAQIINYYHMPMDSAEIPAFNDIRRFMYPLIHPTEKQFA